MGLVRRRATTISLCLGRSTTVSVQRRQSTAIRVLKRMFECWSARHGDPARRDGRQFQRGVNGLIVKQDGDALCDGLSLGVS